MVLSKCYLVAATYRSGSTLLCETLAGAGLAGAPKEFFHPLNMTPLAEQNYVAFIRQTIEETATPNGVFGAKLLWHHVAYICEHVRSFPEFQMPGQSSRDILSALFNGPYYIRVFRRDKLGQAISYVKARQTGVFHHYRDTPNTPLRDPVFDAAAIESALRKCQLDDLAWQAYFDCFRIQPFVVEYETFLERREETIREILNFLGIDTGGPLHLPEAPLKRTADGINQEWRQRFLESRQPV